MIGFMFQMLAPKWHELAESLKDNNDVTISKIDCTKSQKMCNVYDVLSYPTLIWIQGGKKVTFLVFYYILNQV